MQNLIQILIHQKLIKHFITINQLINFHSASCYSYLVIALMLSKMKNPTVAIPKDRCYDHEFVIAPPIAYDHGCVPIGRRDQ